MELYPDVLYRNSHRLVSQVSLDFKREIYDRINWKPRVIGIKGPKGVGKSTLLKQHIREAFPDDSKVLYASLDHIWFNGNSLDDLVEYHYIHGGTHLFLDEVHKYKNWQWGIKNIYDNYPSLNVVFTGSSMLQIDEGNADLSRRATMNIVNGMSFREYLAFEGILSWDKVSLDDILSRHIEIAAEITNKVHVLDYFDDYLRQGYYPFYKEDPEGMQAGYRAGHSRRYGSGVCNCSETEEVAVYHRSAGSFHPEDGRYLHPVGGQPRTGAQALGFAGKGGFDRTAQNQRQGCQEDVVTRQIVPGQPQPDVCPVQYS